MSSAALDEALLRAEPAERPRGLVHTLDGPRFAAACGSLMQLVLRGYRPDLLIGVRTGGLVVADAMAKSVAGTIPVMPLTCRRAGTATKSRAKWLPALLGSLPQPVVDVMRWLENRLLSSRRRRRSGPQQIDHGEAAAVAEYLKQHPQARRLLVVDDAVDSGVTLATVLHLLRDTAPAGIELRSAVVTVTLAHPVAEPDFALYRGVLCRFPWSFDAER